ncbi:MAG: hypothetical protein CL878_14800 [Dehalococcoidia bacterium]|nr:hypothetical protein [Dehalococcoidia bacterium]
MRADLQSPAEGSRLKNAESPPGDEVASGTEGLTGTAARLWNVRGEVERPGRRVPVIADVEVLVAGGGVAGIIAALAAARHGAQTLLVEAGSSLGGNMGPGMFAGGSLHLALKNPEAFPHGLGGIPAEFNQRVVGGEDRRVGSDYFRDHQSVSYVALKMLEEAGADILLTSVISDVLMEDDKARGVFVETKSGTLAIRSRVLVDCTGTADVAARAGAPVIEQPSNPSAGTFFAIANVDWEAYERALGRRGELSQDDQDWMNAQVCPVPAGFMPWARAAWEAGDFRVVDSVDHFATLEITLIGPSRQPPLVRARTRVNGNFHPGDGLAMSRIEQKMRSHIYEFVTFLRQRVPGFSQAYLHVVSPFTHARGGRSIDSAYVVTHEDVERSARFDDVVCIYYDGKQYRPGGCDVPFRMLLPKRVEGLLAAGKSAVRRGPQLRVRYCVQLMGQAAGVAAALAVRDGVEPRQINVQELQQVLHRLGSELGPEARLRELGISGAGGKG